MGRFHVLVQVATVFGLIGGVVHAATVGNLRCEHRVDPSGIDIVAPRLSWTLESEVRGERQSAYQILAAASPEKLQADVGDLWDSGRVSSDASIHVRYGGKALGSHSSCWWK